MLKTKEIKFLGLCIFLFVRMFCSDGIVSGKEIFFQDDFNDGNADEWTVVDEGTSQSLSKWSVSEKAYVQSSNIFTDDKTRWPGTYSYAGNSSWKDYIFETRFKSTDDDGIGVMFRFVDPDNYYRLRLSGIGSWWNGRVLDKISEGEWKILAKDFQGYANDKEWHNLKVILVGNRITIYLDDMGKPIFDINDKENPHLKGKIALYSWGNQNSYFDDVIVYEADLQVAFVSSFRVIPLKEKIPFNVKIVNLSEKDASGVFLKTEGGIKISKPADKVNIKKGEEVELISEIEGSNLGWGTLKVVKDGSKIVEERKILVATRENAKLIPIMGDFHMHSTYSDGANAPIEMLIQAKKVGLDVISVTDHGTTKGSKAVMDFLSSCPVNMMLIIGEENPLDFPNTHLLALNVPGNINHIADRSSKFGGGPEKMCEWAKEQGILIFQAHPTWASHAGTYEDKLKFTLKLLEEGMVVGFEIVNHAIATEDYKASIGFYEKQKEEGKVWPVLGNSDAHNIAILGTVRNMVFVETFTIEAVLKAIKKGKTVVFDKYTDGIYGPNELVDIAQVYKEYFLPVHDRLAEEESKILRFLWGGHKEKERELLRFKDRWEQLYQPFRQ